MVIRLVLRDKELIALTTDVLLLFTNLEELDLSSNTLTEFDPLILGKYNP